MNKQFEAHTLGHERTVAHLWRRRRALEDLRDGMLRRTRGPVLDVAVDQSILAAAHAIEELIRDVAEAITRCCDGRMPLFKHREEDVHRNVGIRLAVLGWTMADLGAALEIHPVRVRSLVRKATTSLDTRRRLAQVLGVEDDAITSPDHLPMAKAPVPESLVKRERWARIAKEGEKDGDGSRE